MKLTILGRIINMIKHKNSSLISNHSFSWKITYCTNVYSHASNHWINTQRAFYSPSNCLREENKTSLFTSIRGWSFSDWNTCWEVNSIVLCVKINFKAFVTPKVVSIYYFFTATTVALVSSYSSIFFFYFQEKTCVWTANKN